MTENVPNSGEPDIRQIFRRWGFWSVTLGGLGLILVFYHIFGISTEPTPSAGQQIGEIAGEIRRSAWRSFLGLGPEPAEPVAPAPMDFRHLAGVAAPILGVIAIVLALISGLRRENWRYPVYGAGLGVASIVFVYIWWLALLFIGAMLLVAIIENIGDIFGGFGG